MSTPAEVSWPNAEKLLIAYLRGALDVRLVTDLPADLETDLPVVQVTRFGGSGDGHRLDRPRLDIDCYAATRGAASALAESVRTALPLLRNQTVSSAVVARVTEESGPSWRPDFNPRVRRFGLIYQLTLRPA